MLNSSGHQNCTVVFPVGGETEQEIKRIKGYLYFLYVGVKNESLQQTLCVTSQGLPLQWPLADLQLPICAFLTWQLWKAALPRSVTAPQPRSFTAPLPHGWNNSQVYIVCWLRDFSHGFTYSGSWLENEPFIYYILFLIVSSFFYQCFLTLPK